MTVLMFPEAGSPASGPRPTPVDLDAVGDRYTALLEARATGDTDTVRLLEGACADDVPALVDEIARVQLLRAELGAEVDRLRDALIRLGWKDDA